MGCYSIIEIGQWAIIGGVIGFIAGAVLMRSFLIGRMRKW